MSLDRNIRDTLQLQDVELANAMNNLKGDRGALTSFIDSRKSDLYNTVASEHSDSFEKVYGDLQRSADTVRNVLYYTVRNKDVDKLQKSLLDRTSGDVDNAVFDSQVAKRQFEINEWTSGNKMDTLFFFQVLFIYLTITAPLLYMKNAGLIPSSVFYGTTGLLTFAVIMTVVVRAQYTQQTRDNRFWNRRRFAQMGGPPVVPSCPAVANLASDLYKTADEYEQALEAEASRYGNALSAVSDAWTNSLKR